MWRERLLKHKLTVCDELNRQGYISDSFKRRTAYKARTEWPRWSLYAYKLYIVPVVLLMKASPWFTRFMHKVNNHFWAKRGVK